jgi:hypothetical protein
MRLICHHSNQRFIPEFMVSSEGNMNKLVPVEQAGVGVPGICEKPFEADTIRQLGAP